MKRFLLLAMTLVLVLACVACEEEVSDEALKSENEAITRQALDLKAELDSVKAELESLQNDYEALQVESEAASVNGQTASDLMAQLQQLQTSYDSLLKTAAQSGLRNPTWDELAAFLAEDETDQIPYVLDEFDCNGFTITLRDNAWIYGFRCAFVAIGFGANAAGHAFNAFETSDRGLVYIEPQHDDVGYLQKGKVFGTIPLEGVKSRFINCNMSPEQFWQAVTYTDYTGDIYAYSYYENYAQRRQFYSDSIEAYNDDVQNFNTAVHAYNLRVGDLSQAEIENWEEKLNSWSANLEKLKVDLGPDFVMPMEAVQTIEIYWN